MIFISPNMHKTLKERHLPMLLASKIENETITNIYYLQTCVKKYISNTKTPYLYLMVVLLYSFVFHRQKKVDYFRKFFIWTRFFSISVRFYWLIRVFSRSPVRHKSGLLRRCDESAFCSLYRCLFRLQSVALQRCA